MNLMIVDDDLGILKNLSLFLRGIGHKVLTSTSSSDALELIQKNDIHLVISDISLPYMDGYELLHKIKSDKRLSHIDIILITGFGDIKGAVQAMKEGALEYLLKPIDLNELKQIIDRIENLRFLEKQNEVLNREHPETIRTTKLAGKQNHQSFLSNQSAGLRDVGIFSEKLNGVFEIAERLHRDTTVPVLIEGETGTGKEIFAKFIHYGYENETSAFIDLNCASIAPTLFESELFGYEKGAYTGGKPGGEKGKIEMAENGTLFLDEIGELPLEFQAKLLRVIQERSFYRVGGIKKIYTNARIICATNKNLQQKAHEGLYRKDLYYRLQVGKIVIPPLRERKEEIIPLANLFLEQFRKVKGSDFTSLTKEAEKILQACDWEGNVRELKNVIERIVTLFDGTIITEEHCRYAMDKNLTLAGNDITPEQEYNAKPVALPASTTLIDQDFQLDSNQGFDLEEYILMVVKKALEVNKYNRTKTAHYLNITRSKLYTYLERLGEV